MNGVIVPCDKNASGTTNITGMTWVQRGNVVQVSLVNCDIPTTGTWSVVTGLPIPSSGNYVIKTFYQGASYIGALQYWDHQWQYGKFAGSGGSGIYDYMIYVTDD